MISIVIPCYNEEASIPLFFKAMEQVREEMQVPFEYLFVDDGSKDGTLKVLRSLAKAYPYVRYTSFSRNFGKEAGLYAGLVRAKGDYVAVMDVDLQDPPELLQQMYQLLQEEPEWDCIGTRRTTRQGEPPIRSFFAKLFYKLINAISDTEVVDGARDFRLMRRSMVEAILQVSEYNRFSKGIFAWVGFQTKYLSYENQERVAGQTSWSFSKLFAYSIDGIVNFSDVPLQIASYLGALSFLVALIGMVVIIVKTLIFGDPTSGWPSMVTIMLFLGSLQLLSLGVLGKYIGKIFMETKRRPLYITKEEEEPWT